MKHTIAILGASPDADRYSYKAQKLLTQHDYPVVLVSPKHDEILGQKAYRSLSDYKEKVFGITMYVSPKISSALKDQILAAKPKVVIFNPGSENPELQAELAAQGTHVVEACTLVLINTNQFEDVLAGK